MTEEKGSREIKVEKELGLKRSGRASKNKKNLSDRD